MLFGVLLNIPVTAEPLRILVPQFDGQDDVGKYVMTTLFYDLSRAFDSQSATQKGVWILYGREPLDAASHDAAVRAASWPSVRADVAMWGRATPYDDDIVVQSFLTITPLAAQRSVRPEVWTVRMTGGPEETVDLTVGLPGRYYEFEPFVLPRELVKTYTSPEGVPLYDSENGDKIVGYSSGTFRFLKYKDEGLLLSSPSGITGWARLPPLPSEGAHALVFAQGVIRFMRGDWAGASGAFRSVLQDRDTPSALRVDTRILLGMAMEQGGRSGLEQFEAAYAANRLDRRVARFMIMGRLSKIEKALARDDDQAVRRQWEVLDGFLKKARILFPSNDEWLAKVERLIENHAGTAEGEQSS